LQSAKDAVNQSSINQQDVKSIPLFLPPLPLQEQFARRVAARQELVARQMGSLTQLECLFASLQHHAFRGEL
jgi:type I restriction enzyme S subunit